MRATVLYEDGTVRVDEVPNPSLRKPTDALVRVVAAAICGSDLWRYRGIIPVTEPRRMGHEFIGTVELVGAEVSSVRRGDFVVAPMNASDGTCVHCRNGIPASCQRIAYWGGVDSDGAAVDGGQGELVRVPLADGTLVRVPEPDPALMPALLALSDVMPTGQYAAHCAGVQAGATVVVVGDGAVGLCGVLAATQLGAHRIVAMSRHPARQRLALRLGASDVVAERRDEGVSRVLDLIGHDGADAVLECVGTADAMSQAIGLVRPGGRIGYVGKPVGGAELPIGRLFAANVVVGGGPAPVRRYLPAMLEKILDGKLKPGLVFDLDLPLGQAPEAYDAMDQRRAVKAMLRP